MTGPVPTATRFLVWTDNHSRANHHKSAVPDWFWSASGPRGHMSGAEMSSQEAVDRAYAAYMLLLGDHEKNQ